LSIAPALTVATAQVASFKIQLQIVRQTNPESSTTQAVAITVGNTAGESLDIPSLLNATEGKNEKGQSITTGARVYSGVRFAANTVLLIFAVKAVISPKAVPPTRAPTAPSPQVNATRNYFGQGETVTPPVTPSPSEPYNRLKHFGKTPTEADRKALGAGAAENVDHKPPLVQRFYKGDPSTGEKPGFEMTGQERRVSAADRSRMQKQSREDSNRQGGQMSHWSREIRKRIFGY
jgi:hypothetical protein